MDCSPPGKSVHGIFLARILEWVAISTSRASSPPRDQTRVSCVFCIAGGFFTSELPGDHNQYLDNTINILLYLLLDKAMAPHSSTLTWKIPRTEEPGGLQSMGSLRVGYNWATSLSLFTFMHWRRKWQPTPVFLPGESQGRGCLVDCHLWGSTESDTTEAT